MMKGIPRIMMALVVVGVAVVSALAIGCTSAESTPTATFSTPKPSASPSVPTSTAVPAPNPPTATRIPPTATQPTVAKPVYGGTLRYVDALGVKTLDPIHRQDTSEQNLTFAIFDSLVEVDENFNVVPNLAQSWEFSANGKDVKFHLQKGVKFQDGSDFNAQAVKWNFQKIVDTSFGSRMRSSIQPYVDNVEVVDNGTIIVHLNRPYRPLMGNMTVSDFRIISPSAWEKYGMDNFGKNPAGTGPFKLKEWVVGDHITLERFDNYRETDKPYLDAIKFQNAADRTVQLAMLRTGETDFIRRIDPSDIPLVRNNPNLRVEPRNLGRWWGLIMDTSRDPWKNKALRQAIAYAVDRKTIADKYLGGYGHVAYILGLGWYGDSNYKIYEYNLQKAREKLVEAGYPNGVTFDYWCQGLDTEMRLCEMVQAMLADVKITAKIVTVPAADYWTDWLKGKLFFGLYRWAPRPDPDYVLRQMLHSTGETAKAMHYGNSEVDKLIDEAVGIYDQSKAASLYLRAQKTVFEGDVPYVTMATDDQIAAMSKRVQNWVWIPDGFARLGFIWLEK